MNVKKVTEKITEWQVAAQNMKSSLSDGDEVYESWIKRMESFMKDFPLLQQLSMDALKVYAGFTRFHLSYLRGSFLCGVEEFPTFYRCMR